VLSFHIIPLQTFESDKAAAGTGDAACLFAASLLSALLSFAGALELFELHADFSSIL
jgi:hypothetical protein